MQKINWKRILSYCCIAILLVFTRIINLGWGLPYPMHPDERNMAVAVQSLANSFNPHFFAYGQFPLYLAYFLLQILHLPLTFVNTTLALRFISAGASIINVFTLLAIFNLLNHKSKILNHLSIILFIFSPALIQFAHFGTTESLLVLFYSLIIYESLKHDQNIFFLALWSGLAAATKISALIFWIVPLMVITYRFINEPRRRKVFAQTIKYLGLSTLFGIIFSPYNLLSFDEFRNSISYESAVAAGRILVFYTRQFVGTIPVLFQLTKIFPYALGWPVFILGILGILGLSWKKKEYNLLRLAFFIYFVPNAFLFAKWTRFMAPIFPLMLIFSVLLLIDISRWLSRRRWRIFNFQLCLPPGRFSISNAGVVLIILISIIPGIMYLRVYLSPDVRFTATEWIGEHVPKNSIILSETANVVDVPFDTQNYRYISFDFYDLDQNYELQQELVRDIKAADYIIVPSRRVFMNHQANKYPKLNDYYRQLFSGRLGFKKVAEFSINKSDEQAEETFSVFDHPVIRIYKKI